MLKVQKLRNNEYYNMQDTFDKLYDSSVNNKDFTKLLKIVTSRENIMLAFRNIKGNTGSNTKGVDGLTIKDYKAKNMEKFIEEVQKSFNDYKPDAVRRVEIPKFVGSKETRPLGIPTLKDRIIQQCLLQVLEPICEAKFSDNSYGFRPNRSAENALAKIYLKSQRGLFHFHVDIDIKGFFDNVNHGKLIKQLWALGIKDKALICIISKMLKAPIVHKNGQVEFPNKGTPQGGVLSPLLSNVVLNELDQWIDSQWQKFPDLKELKPLYNSKNVRHKGEEYRKMRKKTKLKEINIVRYADDFKILCKDYATARKVNIAVKQWLKERLGLEINEAKSTITNLRKKATKFLGFDIKLTLKRNKYTIKSNMTQKAKERVVLNLKNQIKQLQHSQNPVQDLAKYNSMVMGLHNYYNKATHISQDMSEIAFSVKRTMHNRLDIKHYRNDLPNHIYDRYKKSKQIRAIMNNQIIAPIGFCQHKNPMAKDSATNSYTIKGKEKIHKSLGIDLSVVQYLIANPLRSSSTELSDNRISLYVAQKGCCPISKQVLGIGNMELHHKKPRKLGGSDAYKNLILVLTDVHKLIHARNQETIDKYLERLHLDDDGLKKVNKLRKEAELTEIML